jgi:ElaB/YqjD/DUF883 family membrane-anchored ribosome-binding protein
MKDHDIKRAMSGAAHDVRATSAQVQAILDQTADTVAASVAKAGDRAYAGGLRLGAAIEPFVRERPVTALAISAALGLVVGLLMSTRGLKVIYVRPNH